MFITNISVSADSDGLKFNLGLYLSNFLLRDNGELLLSHLGGNETLLKEIYKKLKTKFEGE
jgi:hypothetical protein